MAKKREKLLVILPSPATRAYLRRHGVRYWVRDDMLYVSPGEYRRANRLLDARERR